MAQKVLAQFADAQLFLFVRHLFAVEGFEVVLTSENEGGIEEGAADYVAVVVDAAAISGESGFAQLRRSFPEAAFLVLSRGVQTFGDNLSARDLVLNSPFDPSKLVRFLRQLRYGRGLLDEVSQVDPIFCFADLEMDISRLQVSRGGQHIALTALQFRILRHMLERPAQICTREELIMQCWPEDSEVELRTVDIHLGLIRRTLKRLGPDLIRTVRGAGYALQMPCDASKGPSRH